MAGYLQKPHPPPSSTWSSPGHTIFKKPLPAGHGGPAPNYIKEAARKAVTYK